MSWIVIKCLGISLVVGKFVIKGVVLNIKKNLNAQLAILKKNMIAQCEVYLALGYTTVYKFCCGGLDEVFSLWFTA